MNDIATRDKDKSKKKNKAEIDTNSIRKRRWTRKKGPVKKIFLYLSQAFLPDDLARLPETKDKKIFTGLKKSFLDQRFPDSYASTPSHKFTLEPSPRRWL